MALSAATISIFGQTNPIISPDLKQRSTPVASPNRTSGATLVTNTPRVTQKSTVPTTALVWVDSTGKVMGREKSQSILLDINGVLTQLAGLSEVVNCDVNCTFNAGATLNNYSTGLYYQTTGCSSPPLIPRLGQMGTKQAGVPNRDADGKTFIYFVRSSDLARVMLYSTSSDGQCYDYTYPLNRTLHQYFPWFPFLTLVFHRFT